jgi:hypothetical protein
MNKKYQGGILLTAVLFVYFSSFLLLVTLENFKLSQKFTINNRDFYTEKVMVSMFLAEIKQKDKILKEGGTVHYVQGHLDYVYKDQVLEIKVALKNRPLYYQYKEKIELKKEE